MVIIKNAMWLFGDMILNGMFFHPFTNALNEFQFPFTLYLWDFFPGQMRQDDFTLDLRSIPFAHPAIGEDKFELFLSGQMIYKNQGCPTELKNNNLHFYNNQQSQIVISQSMATCWFAQAQRSKLNHIELDTQKFNQMFNLEGYNLNTTSAFKYIKLF